MHRLVVSYNHPEDPAAFDKYYNGVHAPLAQKIPGLTSYTIGHCESLDDSPPPYYLHAELVFESKEALGAALQSPEGAAAAADLSNFAGAGVSMWSFEEKVIS